LTKSDARKIACGLLPAGLDVAKLPAAARREIRDAIDVLLRLVEENR
jgi:hypothetical protein